MRLVGYVRVSSDSQAENTSLVEQKKKIEAYCYAFGHELVEIFEEVASGKNTADRPVFAKALEAVRTQADGIIAAKLDRLARDTIDVLTLVRGVLQPANKSLVLLDISVDTSQPTGYAMLTMMCAVAELERATINDRTQGGRKAKASSGGYAYGAPAFGQTAEDGKLVDNDAEKQAIEVIRKHRKSGKSWQSIADYLNAQSIPTKRGDRKSVV